MENQDPFWILPIGIMLIIFCFYKIKWQLKRFLKEDKEYWDGEMRLYYIFKLVGPWIVGLILGIGFVLKYTY